MLREEIYERKMNTREVHNVWELWDTYVWGSERSTSDRSYIITVGFGLHQSSVLPPFWAFSWRNIPEYEEPDLGARFLQKVLKNHQKIGDMEKGTRW